MIIETATVWAFSALILMMVVIAVYFAIFFMIFYVMGWAVASFVRPILKILNH